MSGGHVWEWAVRYALGPKRCGSRGWVLDKWRALDRAQDVISRLPLGVTATGHVIRRRPTDDADDGVTEQVAFTVERGKDGEISWLSHAGRDEHER